MTRASVSAPLQEPFARDNGPVRWLGHDQAPQPSAGPQLEITVRDALRSPRLLTREALAGIVTTLALVPEVISFSVIAGVDPIVSLVASVVLAITMSLLGGRPAMVTAAAGSVALVIAPLVKAHGSTTCCRR